MPHPCISTSCTLCFFSSRISSGSASRRWTSRLRWVLFWSTLTLVLALGAGFMYWSYREAQARGGAFPAAGIFAIPHWVAPNIDADFPTAAVYFLVPSAAGAAVYCLVLALFLRIYKQYRAEEHRRRSPPDGEGA